MNPIVITLHNMHALQSPPPLSRCTIGVNLKPQQKKENTLRGEVKLCSLTQNFTVSSPRGGKKNNKKRELHGMQLSMQLPSARSVTTRHASLSMHVALQAGERQQWKERPSQSLSYTLMHPCSAPFIYLVLILASYPTLTHLTESQGRATDPDELYAYMARRNLSFNLSVN